MTLNCFFLIFNNRCLALYFYVRIQTSRFMFLVRLKIVALFRVYLKFCWDVLSIVLMEKLQKFKYSIETVNAMNRNDLFVSSKSTSSLLWVNSSRTDLYISHIPVVHMIADSLTGIRKLPPIYVSLLHLNSLKLC